MSRPKGKRSCSSPPVPCSSRIGGRVGSSPGSKRCVKESGWIWLMAGLSGGVQASSGRTASISPAARLQEGRQFERLAERRQRFVDGKARNIGRDLEQDMARLAEIDGAEVVAVLLLGRADAVVVGELFDHRRLRHVIGRAKGDVMDRTRALPAGQKTAPPRRSTMPPIAVSPAL